MRSSAGVSSTGAGRSRGCSLPASCSAGAASPTCAASSRSRARRAANPFMVAAARAHLGLPADIRALLALGQGDALSRNVFHIFPPGSALPAWVLKFARVPGYSEPFEGDERGLGHCGARGRPVAARAPRLFGRFEHRRHPRLARDGCAGQAASRAPAEAGAARAEDCASSRRGRLDPRSRQGTAAGPGGPRGRAPQADRGGRAALAGARGECRISSRRCRRCRRWSSTTTSALGTSWSTRAASPVLDWESARERGPAALGPLLLPGGCARHPRREHERRGAPPSHDATVPRRPAVVGPAFRVDPSRRGAGATCRPRRWGGSRRSAGCTTRCRRVRPERRARHFHRWVRTARARDRARRGRLAGGSRSGRVVGPLARGLARHVAR